jgi:hypothetical protein
MSVYIRFSLAVRDESVCEKTEKAGWTSRRGVGAIPRLLAHNSAQLAGGINTVSIM